MRKKIFSLNIAIAFLIFGCNLGQCQLKAANLFYNAYNSTSIHSINGALFNIQSYKTQEAKVYCAVLKIKKADFISGISEKIKLFNTGKEILEDAIKQNANNIEWRFLRLTIQQNIPSILGYDDKITQDLQFVYANFSAANQVLKTEIIKYAKNTGLIDVKKLI